MKKGVLAAVLLGGGLAAGVYEWRYSDDMQEHIDTVNRDLEGARSQATYSTGLIGSLQAMRAEADVAGEIIDTHEHVHTVKDQVLAWKIKKAVGDSTTVGAAMHSVIAAWPASL